MMWHESVEKMLQKYCDEAQVRESLHRRAFYWYKKNLTCFQLPIIILSALSGSVQFLSQSLPEYESIIVTSTATLSIGVSIISAVMTYLKLGESKSRHEVAQIAWQNFHNTVAHQLGLARELREDPVDFLTEVKTNYERLFEMSPMINQQFVKTVKKRVNNTSTDAFQVPFYLNGFHHTTVWNDEDDLKNEEFEDNSLNDVPQEVEIYMQEMQSGDD